MSAWMDDFSEGDLATFSVRDPFPVSDSFKVSFLRGASGSGVDTSAIPDTREDEGMVSLAGRMMEFLRRGAAGTSSSLSIVSL